VREASFFLRKRKTGEGFGELHSAIRVGYALDYIEIYHIRNRKRRYLYSGTGAKPTNAVTGLSAGP
jgi:hypothetical protein